MRSLSATYIYPHEDPKLGINGEDFTRRGNASGGKSGDPGGADHFTDLDGIVSDAARIAEIAHRYGEPLIVDEAHGRIFGFGLFSGVCGAAWCGMW